MLRRGLASLNKLDAAEETKRSTKVRASTIPNPFEITISANPLDPELAAAPIAYNSSNPY